MSRNSRVSHVGAGRSGVVDGQDPRSDVHGTVYLVGGGPGDPGLLTRKAARLLRKADVVIHDALVGQGVLDLVRTGAELIDVGKRCGGRRTSQDRINALLIEAAGRARCVVRLKGGDPFVFGRGGEEADALVEAGVPFEVVPGVTAAVGVSAYAGIPLTHRDLASSVTFVTGHERPHEGVDRVDWHALARVAGTLVVYMGVGSLQRTADRLIQGGRDADTPAAIVEWGTHARQRTVSGTLATISADAEAAGIAAPALVIVGEVAAMRERLAWFDQLPLRGRRVLVMRTRAQTSRIAAGLRNAGAEVVELPRLAAVSTPERVSLERILSELGAPDWLVFTSPAAVDRFWGRLTASRLDSRALGGIRIAAFGKATVTALRRHGVRPEIRSRTFVPETAADLILDDVPAESRILFPREAGPASPITRALRERGADVHELPLFRVEQIGNPPFEIETAEVDFVVLPSSTAARTYAASAPGSRDPRIVAIGPRTAEAALACGIPVHAIAGEHTVRGVIDAVIEAEARATMPGLEFDSALAYVPAQTA